MCAPCGGSLAGGTGHGAKKFRGLLHSPCFCGGLRLCGRMTRNPEVRVEKPTSRDLSHDAQLDYFRIAENSRSDKFKDSVTFTADLMGHADKARSLRGRN